MPARTLQCEATVLTRGEPRESCTPFAVLCPENGLLHVLQRRGRGAGGPPLDLFDTASISLSGDESGGHWFVRETRIERRRPGIAARYEALLLASRFTATLARNPPPEDALAGTAALAERALEAFAGHPELAEVVYLKSNYSFARSEGYAVRGQWLAELHGALREEAEVLLATPLSALAPQAWVAASAARLVPRMEHWLREHTEIRLHAP